MNPILEINDLTTGYNGTPLTSGINLTLREGEVTAMIGRNGVGKSTLIKTLTRHIPPIKGEIWLLGKLLHDYSRKDLSKIIAQVTTDSDIAGGLRLHELVSLGRIPFTGVTGVLSTADHQIVRQAMEGVDIIHKKDNFISELSDGERQKGMIARALSQETPLIIMDEPFSYLDVAARLEMLALVRRLAREERKAILFSTHEVSEALRMADRIWMFADGEIREGNPRELVESGEIDRLFSSTNVRFDKNTWNFTL